MANQVYANSREVSCKAGSGKTVCALPDVCFTPPQTPATPPGVPIPYPNTGMSSDTTDGSKHVKISGKEVMLKDKSYFKRSTGDEAGCAPKKGFVTSQNMGKVYFNSWSMDVKFEGENVVRHLDVTTHNHASFPGNSPTWPFLDAAAFEGGGKCAGVAKETKTHCVGKEVTNSAGKVKRKASIEAMCKDEKCAKALKCVLTPKSPPNCCPDENGHKPTPHHIVPASQFNEIGDKASALLQDADATDKYRYNKAPCICADGHSHSIGKHGEMHSKTNALTRKAVGVPSGKQIPGDKRWPVGSAEAIGAQAVEEATDDPKCPKECIEAQVRAGHQAMGIDKNDSVRPTTAGGEEADSGTGI